MERLEVLAAARREADVLRSYELDDAADALLRLVLEAEGAERVLRDAYRELAEAEGYENCSPEEMVEPEGPEGASSLLFALARVPALRTFFVLSEESPGRPLAQPVYLNQRSGARPKEDEMKVKKSIGWAHGVRQQGASRAAKRFVVKPLTKAGKPSKVAMTAMDWQLNAFADAERAEARRLQLEKMNPGSRFVVVEL